MISFVKTLAQQLTKEQSLVDLLHKELTVVRPARSFDKIRASQLTATPEFCPREIALLDITKKPLKPQHLGVSQNVTFDQGLSLQYFVLHKWLKNYVVGDWQCQVCFTIVPLCLYPKEPCPSCNRKVWKYKEIEASSLEDGYHGSLDAIIKISDGSKLYLTEVKTMV